MITLSDEQDAALTAIMTRELASSRSAYIAGLIGREYQAMRADVNRKPVGRPRKVVAPSDGAVDSDEYEDTPDYSHDTPKNIMHFGRMIGPRELADIQKSSGDFKPQA